MSAVRLEPLTVFLSLSFTLFLTALLATTYSGGNWLKFGITDYLARFIHLIESFFAGGVLYLVEIRSQNQEEQLLRTKFRAVWPLMRGILIAIPILVILIILLASADVVFSQKLEDLTEVVGVELIPEYLFRGTYILLVALFLAGLLLHTAGRSRAEKIEIKKPAPPVPFLGFTETTVVLGSILALFLSFVFIQVQYFFGGEKNIEGYTYSEYARRGFGELLAVALIVLLLLLVFGIISRREGRQQRTTYALLGAGIVGLVLVMLVSAFQRMMLYETAYGFSRLRTYTHVFMIWLAVLLVGVLVLEIIQRPRAFVPVLLFISLGFAVTLNVMNIDGFISSRNVMRSVDGQELDVAYLKTLSYDAVPTLAGLFRDQTLPQNVHEQLREVLTHFAGRRAQLNERSWKSFHLSHQRAETALNSLEDEFGGTLASTIPAPQ